MIDKTILIVDDTPENIDILNSLLSDFKRKVATNGKKAIQLIESSDHPDLLLLDIDMPEMNGFEVCQVVKSNPATKDIPIIFLTGNTNKKMTVEGFKLGANDFITKPFNPEELMVRVMTQLGLREAKQRLESTIQQLEVTTTLLKQSGEEMNRQKKISEEERNRANALLLNIMPSLVANELKEKGTVAPMHYPIVSVLFADLAGFTRLSKGLSPAELLQELNPLFVGFDMITEKHNMEKIKTLGDGYMSAGGIPVQNSSNPVDAVLAALEMIEFIRKTREENAVKGKPPWALRVGVHTGPIVAGVLGKTRFNYDIWGATVNTASRMESAGEPGRVNISGITYQLVKDKFKCTSRGDITVKNMGKMDMYFVEQPLIESNMSSELHKEMT